jgi:FkbM family methyltransferase
MIDLERLVSRGLAHSWAGVQRAGAPFVVFADRRSRKAFQAARAGPIARNHDDNLVELKLRALHGESIWIRAGTSDAAVLFDAFVKHHHRPSPIPPGDVYRIWDLGSNIGLTMIDFALLFPHAEILGVELDTKNADLGRRNVAPWSERCRLLGAAVWVRDDGVLYRRWPGFEYGSAVVPVAQWESPLADLTARSMSLNTLLCSHGVGASIDYVKMDIEGAERFVLRENTQWAKSVLRIAVEVHQPYTLSECARDLENLGFRTSVRRERPPCVEGRRSTPRFDVATQASQRR